MPGMRRREFVSLLGGAAAAWPLAARAQQRRAHAAHRRADGPPRRTIQKRKPVSRRSCRACSNWAGPMAAMCGSSIAGATAMLRHSQKCGRIGRTRAGRHPGWHRAFAPLLQATRTVPIVFVQVVDPVGAGLIESLARPGGNATGFTSSIRLGGKWLELLKEMRRL